MSEESEEIMAQPAAPTHRRMNFPVAKTNAKSIRLGDTVTVTVTGEVCGVSNGYGPGADYNVELKISGLPKIDANKADKSLRAMLGEGSGAPRHKNEAEKSLDDIHSGKKRAY